MARYKVLGSVAHNLGHSFLSDMNTVDSFVSFIPELLYHLAQQHRTPRVTIDFFGQSVSPEPFATRDVLKSVMVYGADLPRLVESQGASWDSIRGVTLELVFQLSDSQTATRRSREVPPKFECVVTIVDDRGKAHCGYPTNWC